MKKHCCEVMDSITTLDCEQHDIYTCPDVLIIYIDKYDEYGISIKDGGPSISLINYCPYCGSKLPGSKRDLWFDTLEDLGFDDPGEQNIPKEFHTSEWYQKKNL